MFSTSGGSPEAQGGRHASRNDLTTLYNEFMSSPRRVLSRKNSTSRAERAASPQIQLTTRSPPRAAMVRARASAIGLDAPV